MELIAICVILAIAATTGITTFVVTKNVYDDRHEKIKAQINNQLIINEEKDKAHEYSQTIFMIILAVITSCVVLYITLKCTVNAILNRVRASNVSVRAIQPQQHAEFNA